MQNLETLRQLFLGDLADDGREERGKIMPSLMATSLRWRTHSARTNIEEGGVLIKIYSKKKFFLNLDPTVGLLRSMRFFKEQDQTYFDFI